MLDFAEGPRDDLAGWSGPAHGGTLGGDSLMKQAGGHLYEYESSNVKEEAITMAHEFGHCLLHASDEYANPAVPGRVLTNDHSIMANYYTQEGAGDVQGAPLPAPHRRGRQAVSRVHAQGRGNVIGRWLAGWAVIACLGSLGVGERRWHACDGRRHT